jgi:hypothetical protein
MRRRRRITVYPTTRWNQIVEEYFRNRIADIDAAPDRAWRHPWYSVATWDAKREQFLVRTKAGACPSFTSDGDPTVSTLPALVTSETLERVGVPADSTAPIDAYLSEDPKLAVSTAQMRAIGTDAVAFEDVETEAIPPFFQERGVLAPVTLENQGGRLVSRFSGLVEDRSQARLLRATDLVLTHRRLLTVPILKETPEGNAEITLTLQTPPGGVGDPYLDLRSKYEPEILPGGVEFAAGDLTDPGRDTIHLATVYFLSPRGAEAGTMPDGNWRAFTRHHVQWNLQYLAKESILEIDPTRLEVPLPALGLGTLGDIGGRLAQAGNDTLAQMEAALREVRNEGRFLKL